MLGKLMKYEFMATGRVFLPLYAALIIISCVNRLLMSFGMQTPGVIGIVVSVILIVGIFVLTLILAIQRFRQNLLSNEGYLMMTLPVKTDSLILSKLFVSAVWAVASFIVVVLAVTIMAATEQFFSDFIGILKGFFERFLINAPQTILYTVETVIMIAITILLWALIIYACISLSMLVNKRRGLFTFGAFIVLTTALQILFTIIVTIATALGIPDMLRSLTFAWSSFTKAQFTVLTVFLITAILCAVFYFLTRYMLKKRLNLQ